MKKFLWCSLAGLLLLGMAVAGYWAFRSLQASRPSVKSDLARLLDLELRRLESLAKGYPTALVELPGFEGEVRAEGGRLARGFVMEITPVARNEAAAVARLELAHLAARAFDYRRRSGRFPAELKDFGEPPAPECPLTGKPFTIERRDGKVQITSAGDPSLMWNLGDQS